MVKLFLVIYQFCVYVRTNVYIYVYSCCVIIRMCYWQHIDPLSSGHATAWRVDGWDVILLSPLGHAAMRVLVFPILVSES